jgi:hypothetical protein
MAQAAAYRAAVDRLQTLETAPRQTVVAAAGEVHSWGQMCVELHNS